MIKKLAATGILGLAVAGSALAATPAYAAALGGDGHHGKKHHGSFNDNETGPNVGLLNGNQVFVPISIPVDVCGNAVAVIGGAQAGCKGGASVNN
ncbi:chaplin family protein [Actinomadura sp. B10D3]|uniref:chaplin family protein n=1 Tax=Actinomadura sp. B10D3 TaxID=3153557 RepID=UPI00325CD49A